MLVDERQKPHLCAKSMKEKRKINRINDIKTNTTAYPNNINCANTYY